MRHTPTLKIGFFGMLAVWLIAIGLKLGLLYLAIRFVIWALRAAGVSI